MTSVPNIKEPQFPLNRSSSFSIRSFAWLKQSTRRLSVSQKIGFGYGLALSIIVLGTTAGFTIGRYYQKPALETRKASEEEIRLLSRLQSAVLQARTHQQQFIPLMPTPDLLADEYHHFLEHAVEIDQVLAEIKAYTNSENYKRESHVDGILSFLKTYEGVPKTYFAQVQSLMGRIEPTRLTPTQVEAEQKRLLTFTNSSIALNFDGISDELTEVIKRSYQDAAQTEVALKNVESLRIQIILFSIVLSIGTAILLGIYTSRSINRPLRSVTSVAQRVTQESNFDLQAPVTTEDEVGVLATAFNQLIHKVKHLLEKQKSEAEAQLIQSEKMSSLGRMLAGVAHEINNPVNFIYGNINHTSEYFTEIINLLETYEAEIPNPPLAVQSYAEEIDIQFIKEDLPKLLQSLKVGAERTREIVLSLKNFSRLDEDTATLVDLHACIDSTLLILNNRIKNQIKVTRRYGNLPAIEGYMGLLYQVFMNILSNAIDALDAERLRQGAEIAIATERLENDWVMIRITDNGSGIAAEAQEKIFDAFFTTKPRGVGTGLGLAISHQIVVQKHGGKLTCNSKLDQGTEFAIALPLKHTSTTESVTPILCY